ISKIGPCNRSAAAQRRSRQSSDQRARSFFTFSLFHFFTLVLLDVALVYDRLRLLIACLEHHVLLVLSRSQRRTGGQLLVFRRGSVRVCHERFNIILLDRI